MRTRGYTVPKRVKFDLMDDSIVLLVVLDWFFGGQVPNVYYFIIARDEIRCDW